MTQSSDLPVPVDGCPLRAFIFTFSKAVIPSFVHVPSQCCFPNLLHLFVSSDRDEFHYCSQSGPGGQLLCTSVHLNIILLIKGLPCPPRCRCPAPALALFPRTTPAFCSPRLSPTRFMSSHALAIWKGETSPLSLLLSCVFNLCCNIAVCVCVRACVSVCVRMTGTVWLWGSSSIGLIRVKSAFKGAWLPVIGCW